MLLSPESKPDASNSKVLQVMARISRSIGVLLVLTGCIVMAGWISGVEMMTRLAPFFDRMRFNSALGLATGGIAITAIGTTRPMADRIAKVATLACGTLGF